MNTKYDNRNQVGVLASYTDFKRIQSITYDKSLEEYTIKLEERFKNRPLLYSYGDIEYYKKWLNSLGDAKAHQITYALDMMVKGKEMVMNQILKLEMRPKETSKKWIKT